MGSTTSSTRTPPAPNQASTWSRFVWKNTKYLKKPSVPRLTATAAVTPKSRAAGSPRAG